MDEVTRRNAIKMAVVTGVAVVAGAATADDREKPKEPERSEVFKKMMTAGEIRGPLKMADGSTSGSITIATSLPGQSRSRSADWAFQVPAGFVRYSANFQTDHHGGDVAQCGWANDNPADGTVHAHVKASQTNGYARAACDNVYAISVNALAGLLEESRKAAIKPTHEHESK